MIDISQMTDEEFETFVNSANTHTSDEEVLAIAAGWRVEAQHRREHEGSEEVR